MSKLLEIMKKQDYVIIAEIGVNYYDIAVQREIDNLEAAKLMCKEAKIAGADAVKFQSYKADNITSKFASSYWDITEESTSSQYELFKKYDLFGANEYHEIAEYCKDIGVVFMSTPFDFDAVDYLDNMVEEYKISSSDLTNLPFIDYICKKNKPIILSTGASNELEIKRAMQVINIYGNTVSLLHCVLEYPTPLNHANLGRIIALKQLYPNCILGYSDHTKPTEYCEVITTAYALGARIIEKHFTLDKTLPGNDHYHAMDMNDLKMIKQMIEKEKKILGKVELTYLESEQIARANARRSIVLKNNLKKGSIIKSDDLAFKRPGTGISPEDYEKVVGKRVNRDIAEDNILQWEEIY